MPRPRRIRDTETVLVRIGKSTRDRLDALARRRLTTLGAIIESLADSSDDVAMAERENAAMASDVLVDDEIMDMLGKISAGTGKPLRDVLFEAVFGYAFVNGIDVE